MQQGNLFNLKLYSTVDKRKLIWSEFLLSKTFPEWLWPRSPLGEVADRQGSLIFEDRSVFKVRPASQGLFCTRVLTVPCKDQECSQPSGSAPVAHALWGAVFFNRSLMKPGFARACFLVLKTRTRKKNNLEYFLTIWNLTA